jgi:hypothetical protein
LEKKIGAEAKLSRWTRMLGHTCLEVADLLVVRHDGIECLREVFEEKALVGVPEAEDSVQEPVCICTSNVT